MKSSYKDNIMNYILENFKSSDPIIQKNLYKTFINIKPITIRQTLLRLSMNGSINKSPSVPGVYFLSRKNTLLASQSVDFIQLVEKKFLYDQQLNIIGYESGLSMANKLRLSSQTSTTVFVVSNAVAQRKREIIIDHRKFIVDKPRIEIDARNYKFLQVLDIISDFDAYCDIEFEKAMNNIKSYLSDLTLSKEEMEKILGSYPMKTERNYYKLGVDHVIAQGHRSI